jgi:uncharacterized protein
VVEHKQGFGLFGACRSLISTLTLALAVTFLSAICPASALDVPALTGRVVDLAHVLTTDERGSLSAALQSHEERTGNQVAV